MLSGSACCLAAVRPAIPPMVPGMNRPQSLLQELPEIFRLPGEPALDFLQQHFAPVLQQEDAGELSERAASGTRAAIDNNTTRHADTSVRAALRQSKVGIIPRFKNITRVCFYGSCVAEIGCPA